MASFTAAARAMSPPVAVIAHKSTDFKDLRDIRHQGVMLANTVQDVIECVPSDYKSACANHLLSLAAETERLCKARSTVAQWKHHQSVGTLPPHLRAAPPQVQFTAGYGSTEAAKAAQQEINDAHAKCQITLLASMITAREKEVELLEGKLSPEAAALSLRTEVVKVALQVQDRYKIPIETRRAGREADGDEAMADIVWEIAPAFQKMRDQVLADCPLYASRVVSICLNRHAAMQTKIEKKRSVAAAATVAASDGGLVDETATLDKTIKDLVKRHVMGLMPREPKSKAKGKGPAQQAKVSAAASRYHIIADFFAEGSGSSPSQDHGTRDRKSTRLNSSHERRSRMPSSA